MWFFTSRGALSPLSLAIVIVGLANHLRPEGVAAEQRKGSKFCGYDKTDFGSVSSIENHGGNWILLIAKVHTM